MIRSYPNPDSNPTMKNINASREVVERRVYTVTGERASETEIDRMIETGESETIFQKAILEQGRGHVRKPLPLR